MSRVDIWPIARKPLPLPRLKEIGIFMDAQQVEALSYSQALQALDDIVAQLEEGKVDFDSIKPLVAPLPGLAHGYAARCGHHRSAVEGLARGRTRAG